MLYELKQKYAAYKDKFYSLEAIFEIAAVREDIRKIEQEISQNSFWEDNTKAQDIFGKLNRLKNIVEEYESIDVLFEDAQVFIDLLEEEENDSNLSETINSLNELQSKVESLEIKSVLSEKYDTYSCIFSLNSGAGGTDAQDWVQMLFRMYIRWCEKKDYTCEVVDQTYGDEAGIKSVTFVVKGSYAYGYLKNETGVHRLVRQSPFNANNKRQTSFAAVDVVPRIDKDFSGMQIDEKDLRIDTFRASGAGGQHVNKTDSAVRITHTPTGTVAQSQSNRSQLSNRETALTILKSRLILLMEVQHKEKLHEIRGETRDIAWGNQIRSYVFHPYKLVKDLRTGEETSSISNVMDGDIDRFIRANLLRQRG
ncbi:MAG: peptide chain release factor 2 [bacterium]|nr:peptide chain release factor 2 [bacterium]